MVIISCLGNCNYFFPVFTLHTHTICSSQYRQNRCSFCMYNDVILLLPPASLCLSSYLSMKYSEVELTKIFSMGLKTLCSSFPCAFPSQHAPVFPCLSALQQGLHPVSHTCHGSSHHRAFAHAVTSTRNSVFPFLQLVKSFYSFRVHVLRKYFPVTLIQVRFV